MVTLAFGGIIFGGAQLLLTPHHGMTTAAGTVIALDAAGDGAGDDQQITLKKSAVTERVGTYGLQWAADAGTSATAGTATIGPVISSTADTVVRPISNIQGTLSVGTAVALNPNIYTGDPETSLGIPFSTVDVDGDLGTMPAWQVEGTGTTWVLFVHGIDGLKQSALRPLPTLVSAGLPTLVISYRNDTDAPASPNGLIHLGETEWHDLDSAAAYALTQGATDFILYGDSMGGSMVTQFMHQSEYAPKVVGMVLDAPVLNWAGVLQGQADRLHVGFLGGALKAVVSWRGDIDLGMLNELTQTETFENLPILLFQGLADPLVPPAESQQFAEALPLATYVPVPDAGHIQSWNVDPASYEAHLATFLASLAPVAEIPDG
ncbi:alpha/beta fold hydrolase [Leifsonia kafniensis]|uniref:Alpha/beta fold hydrolase n=1 Tax=Leifsonia kafniensis TaxID=475957 RepID=A0ABP7K1A0_9MICO